MLNGEGIETGIDLNELVTVAHWLEGVLDHELPGLVYRAGAGSFDKITSKAG